MREKWGDGNWGEKVSIETRKKEKCQGEMMRKVKWLRCKIKVLGRVFNGQIVKGKPEAVEQG